MAFGNPLVVAGVVNAATFRLLYPDVVPAADFTTAVSISVRPYRLLRSSARLPSPQPC